MSLIERIDLALLVRADTMVAWNRDRGRANQWEMAKVCPDIALAFLAAAFVVDATVEPRFSGPGQLGYVFVSFIFGFIRSREMRSIKRLSEEINGAMRARVSEAGLRQTNILILSGMTVLSIFAAQLSDIPFMLGVMALGATNYFKAAEPPPPATRHDKVLAPVG